MPTAMVSQCPPIQNVSPKTIEAILQLVDSGKVVSGPIGVYDVERQVFLVAVFEAGVLVAWHAASCPTQTDAAHEKQRMVNALGFAHFAATDEGIEVMARLASVIAGDVPTKH